jgi:hypothetical protein
VLTELTVFWMAATDVTVVLTVALEVMVVLYPPPPDQRLMIHG